MKKTHTDRVSDAVDHGWVEEFSPPWFLPYLQLSRLDRPIGWWLLLLPCWWGLLLAMNQSGVPRFYDLWIATGCFFGAILMRGAGCTWNDLADMDFDAQVERTKSRPLPSERISKRNAILWLIFQCGLAGIILLTFNNFTILIGLSSLLLVVIYPFAKRFTWWPQLFLGLAFNWGVLVGWAAHLGSLSLSPVLLYLSGIFWTLFYDTIYAHQDSQDDLVSGIKSTALLFGEKSKFWLGLFCFVSCILMVGAVLLAYNPFPNSLPLFLALITICFFGGHLLRQLKELDIHSPENCLKQFRANRDSGIIIVFGFTASLLLYHFDKII